MNGEGPELWGLFEKEPQEPLQATRVLAVGPVLGKKDVVRCGIRL